MQTVPTYLFEYPDGTLPSGAQSTVHRADGGYRTQVAMEQAKVTPPDVERVAELANEALELLGIAPVESPLISVDPADIGEDGMVALDYDAIAQEHHLASPKDVVNIRFDAEGHPVLVAVSDDVNFCPLPSSSADYDSELANGDWQHTTAAVILHALGTDWDRSRLLLFPLTGLSATGYQRHDAEMSIGNHLLKNGVALLDKYSHCY